MTEPLLKKRPKSGKTESGSKRPRVSVASLSKGRESGKKKAKNVGVAKRQLTGDKALSVLTVGKNITDSSKILKPGKLHKIYITDKLSGVMHMPEKERSKYIKKLQNSSILEIRKNTKLLTKELKGKNDAQKAIDRTEECRRRIAAYSDKHEGGWSRVNYSQMDIDPNKPSHEDGVGLGETYGLDPNNKKLAVKDRNTGEITIVTRGIVARGERYAGRMAYLDKSGNYFSTFSGDWVRILSGYETDLKNPKELEGYMAELKKDTEIRNKYTKDNIDYGGEEEGGNLKEKHVVPRRTSVSNYFPKNKKGEKLWKSIPEARFVDDGVKINPRESFVSGKDSFGRAVILRKSAMRAFYRARKIAESGKYQTSSGPAVRLKVTSSYRSFADQQRLNPSGKGGKYVAAPGTSWHHSGGAIDIIAYVQNPSTGKWEGGHRHKNQIYLKKILPRASFANLPHEMWHWEYGSTRWKRKTRRRTRKYTKVMSVNKRRIGRLDRLT